MGTREEYKKRRQVIGTRKRVAELMGGEKPQKIANWEQGKQRIPPLAWYALEELERRIVVNCKCKKGETPEPLKTYLDSLPGIKYATEGWRGIIG